MEELFSWKNADSIRSSQPSHLPWQKKTATTSTPPRLRKRSLVVQVSFSLLTLATPLVALSKIPNSQRSKIFAEIAQPSSWMNSTEDTTTPAIAMVLLSVLPRMSRMLMRMMSWLLMVWQKGFDCRGGELRGLLDPRFVYFACVHAREEMGWH